MLADLVWICGRGPGLGLQPVETTFAQGKRTVRMRTPGHRRRGHSPALVNRVLGRVPARPFGIVRRGGHPIHRRWGAVEACPRRWERLADVGGGALHVARIGAPS